MNKADYKMGFLKTFRKHKEACSGDATFQCSSIYWPCGTLNKKSLWHIFKKVK